MAKEKTKDSTSRKSFSGSSSQTLVFGRDKQQPEIRLRSQARLVLDVSINRRFITKVHNAGFDCSIFFICISDNDHTKPMIDLTTSIFAFMKDGYSAVTVNGIVQIRLTKSQKVEQEKYIRSLFTSANENKNPTPCSQNLYNLFS